MTSENYHNLLFSEAPSDEQLSVPVVSSAFSLTGSACPFSRDSAPVSSAWLLPSGSGTSQQLCPGSAYLYQHLGSTMLSGHPGQSYISMSAASSSGAFEWQLIRNIERRSSSLGDIPVTIINQHTSVPSMARAAQYSDVSQTSAIATWNPALPSSLVRQTASRQRSCLSLPYQEDSRVCYYYPVTLGPLLWGGLGPCLQPYGSGPHAVGEACAPQQQLTMVLKEIHPTNTPAAVHTSGVHYPVPARNIPGTSCGVIKASQDTDTSLGIRTSPGFPAHCQTACLPQTAELIQSCTQMLESSTPPRSGDISTLSPIQHPSDFLALPPPSPSQEQALDKALDEVKAELAKLLENHQISKDNSDAPPRSLKIPNTCDIIASIEPASQGNTPGSDSVTLGQWLLGDGPELNIGSADISTLVGDVCLPWVSDPQTDCDLRESTTATNTKDTGAAEVGGVQEKAMGMKALPDLLRKKGEKFSEPVDGIRKAKLQRQDSEHVVQGEVGVGSAAASDRAPDITAKPSHCRAQKAASSRPIRAKGPGQKQTKRSRENNGKKCEERILSGSKVKAEERLAIPKTKRKDRPPELWQEDFKKPRASLGMHMLGSVQVFHTPRKKTEQKTGVSSSQALGNTCSTKELKTSPAPKSGLHISHPRSGPEKTQGKGQKPEGRADTPSQGELPPPGKVKSVPLPFLNPDKRQARPVPQRTPSLASQRDPAPDPARPPSHSAQLPVVNPSQPAPASTSCIGATQPAGPVSTRPGFNIPTQPRVSQSAASRPAPYKTSSCTSLHRDPVPTAPTKPHTPYLLEDFSRQPIPWRKVDFPGPVVSTPITDEQRPEREAMKRQAQREREDAAQYTALGRVQYFVQREKDMEISQYYGYAK